MMLELVHDYLEGLYTIVECIPVDNHESYNMITILNKMYVNKSIILTYITDKKPYKHKAKYLDIDSLYTYTNIVKRN